MKFYWWKPFIDLIYPPLCAGCGWQRPVDRHIFCMDCIVELPETGYHQYASNPFVVHFKGRIPVTAGAAFLFFSRGSGTQHLLHQIKYNNRPDLITVIGKWYGKQLLEYDLWQAIDLVIPVPLHWKKQRLRGYNQSAIFGQAIGEVMNVPCKEKALRRLTHDSSLTGMNRFERVQTIQSSFTCSDASLVRQKHILLVDDVLTTGSTLEACAHALIKEEVASIRMVTIACGEL